MLKVHTHTQAWILTEIVLLRRELIKCKHKIKKLEQKQKKRRKKEHD